MCGRYYVEYDETVELFKVIKQLLNAKNIPAKNGDIRPSEKVPVITAANRIDLLTWGIKVSGKSLIINARSETVQEKPLFRKNNRRCIIPASGFYEWTKNKEKHYYVSSEKVIYMAGLYGPSGAFAILTRSSEPPVSLIHDREPVILTRDMCRSWLSGQEEDPSSFFSRNAELYEGDIPELAV